MREATTRGSTARPWRPVPEGAEAVPGEWAGLEALSAANARQWPELGQVGWFEIAKAIGAPGVRVAQYRLSQHGWRFGGRGVRVVTQAPCDCCGQPTDPKELTARRCHFCAT